MRIVPQIEILERDYRFTSDSARYAVFADLVMDLSARRIAWSDLRGIVGPADGDTIVRRKSAGQYEAIDLRTGAVMATGASEGMAVAAAAPEQTWDADARDGPGPDPTIVAPPAVKEALSALAQRKPARVLDIKLDGSALLTGSEGQVCLWSMTELARTRCAPREFQSYSYLPDGRLLGSNSTPTGSTLFVLLDDSLEPSQTQPQVSLPLVPSELEWPCGWDVEAGPHQNVFRRGEATLFTLHDLESDWAIVLADGRYLASTATPAALAFFDASGSLAARELVLTLHQPAQVRAALRKSAPEGCPF